MNECEKHCDHSLGRRWISGGEDTESFRCCHCGRTRTVRLKKNAYGYWKRDEKKHGPHAPVRTPYFN